MVTYSVEHCECACGRFVYFCVEKLQVRGALRLIESNGGYSGIQNKKKDNKKIKRQQPKQAICVSQTAKTFSHTVPAYFAGNYINLLLINYILFRWAWIWSSNWCHYSYNNGVLYILPEYLIMHYAHYVKSGTNDQFALDPKNCEHIHKENIHRNQYNRYQLMSFNIPYFVIFQINEKGDQLNKWLKLKLLDLNSTFDFKYSNSNLKAFWFPLWQKTLHLQCT